MKNSTEIAKLMHEFYESISRGDISLLEEILSHRPGTLWIGTDPKEWWTERGEVIRVWQAQMKELGGAMIIESTNLQAHVHGDVGWLADQVIGRLPDGTAIPFRITAVFEKEAEGWRIVQVHSSVAIANEDVMGKELST